MLIFRRFERDAIDRTGDGAQIGTGTGIPRGRTWATWAT